MGDPVVLPEQFVELVDHHENSGEVGIVGVRRGAADPNAGRAGRDQEAAARRASARSVFSQVNSGRSRPKWP